ncbi:hypothetical protein C8R46DRAFT_1075261 [Mycena filopes]|nr:hypothetical protein C8R46DRAFT_1075261 [Mycena filopes]
MDGLRSLRSLRLFFGSLTRTLVDAPLALAWICCSAFCALRLVACTIFPAAQRSGSSPPRLSLDNLADPNAGHAQDISLRWQRLKYGVVTLTQDD